MSDVLALSSLKWTELRNRGRQFVRTAKFKVAVMAAYGNLFDAPWHFYAGSAVFLAAFMFLPAALGAIVSILVTVYIPRTRKSLVLGVVLAATLGILIFVTRIVVSGRAQSMDLKL